MPSSACTAAPRILHSFPTRRSSDLSTVPLTGCPSWRTRSRTRGVRATTSSATVATRTRPTSAGAGSRTWCWGRREPRVAPPTPGGARSEEHTSELQSLTNLVCRLLLVPPPPVSYTLSLHDALPIYRPCL